MPESEEAYKQLSQCPDEFIKVLRLAIWICEGETHGLEFVYLDDELLVFKRKPA